MAQEDKLKIDAFDLISSGEVTGMSLFWKNFAHISKLPHNEILEKMAKYAIEEAYEMAVKNYRGM